jgi:prepilin-type N-terminal cleavage/methylation domain-containing protein
MKKGFTLLEIIVVLIILGIIATLGFLQYSRVIEKGRTSEAKTNLGTIRTMAMAYYEENGAYFDQQYINDTLSLSIDCGGTLGTKYYFSYNIDTDGAVSATRCAANGKPPACAQPACPAGGYTLTLQQDGVASSSPTGWW